VAVIAIIGAISAQETDGGIVPTGTPARAALAAAATGRQVQLVGRTGDDPTADALLLSLTKGGVGHAALLRDPTRATPLVAEPPSEDASLAPPDDQPAEREPEFPSGPALDAGDVDLGLRYLTDYAVIVLAEPAGPDVVRVVADAAGRSGARLLVVVEAGGGEPPAGLPPEAIVFEAPEEDPDGDFAALVGRFAAALDDGADAEDAFRSSLVEEGWTEAVAD